MVWRQGQTPEKWRGFSRESTGFGIHDDLWWVWLCFDRRCFNYSINCNGKPSLDQFQGILPDGRNFIDYPIHDSTKIIRINQLIWMQKPWSATDVPLNYSNVGKTITICTIPQSQSSPFFGWWYGYHSQENGWCMIVLPSRIQWTFTAVEMTQHRNDVSSTSSTTCWTWCWGPDSCCS